MALRSFVSYIIYVNAALTQQFFVMVTRNRVFSELSYQCYINFYTVYRQAYIYCHMYE
jgi:hypothetical protein